MYDIRIIKTSIGCKDGSQETLNPLQSSLTPKVGTNDGGSGGENMTWKTLSWEKGPRASETFFFFCRHKYKGWIFYTRTFREVG